MNIDKYICFCRCIHSCVLRYCMKEDPNMIREGFAEENNNEMGRLLSIEGDVMITDIDRDND